MAAEDDPTDLTGATKREGAGSSKSVRIKRATAQPELTRGTLVGRYVLLDKIGEGGMGVVHGAFDPELDRKVAIKVLQAREATGSSGGDQAWLLREAQALARLSHPNVVAVHDVGTLPGDQVFVAMELVDGVTMRQWLKAEVRTWRDVVQVMRAAGAGLAAAHAAGLVHRDFKPENVLVGSDGRIRVMDFGLARLRADDDDGGPIHVESKSPLSADLTLAGHVVGTPAYMAPEVYEGDAADARSDQFAFGVTLFEGLYRARPYAKEDLMANRAAPPAPKIPADIRVPAALHRIALRAIAIDPAQRFASMDELLAQLAIDPTARRRRALLALAGLAAAAGVAGGAIALHGSSSRVCKGLDARLAGVWDAPTRQRVHEAFVATHLPFAEQAYAALAPALDGYAHDWVSTAVESCEATRVRRDQTEEVLSLRQECLDQRLDELASLVRVLAAPNRALVEKAGKAATELEPVSRCSNVSALREPNKPSPALAPKVHELDKKIGDAKAQLIAGNYLAAGANASEMSRIAADIGFYPGVADAELLRANTLMIAQNWDDAATAFRAATWAAMQGRRDDILAHGALSMASVDATGRGKPAEARIWFELAQAAAKRMGGDRGLDVRVLEVGGEVAAANGDLAAAMAAHEKALALGEAMFGRENPMLWENEQIYAATLTKALHYADAIPHYERAIALRERVVGPDHPDIALTLSNLGICYSHIGDARARATFERALALREKLFGKNNPIIAPTLDNFGDFLRREGETSAAVAVLDRAFKLVAVFPGKDHPNYHQVASDYAETLVAAGRLDEARALFDDVLALEAHAGSPLLPETQTLRSELALAEHRWTDAESFADHAVAGYETAGGRDNTALWRPLTALARARLELHRSTADIRPLLERAIAIGERTAIPARDLAPTRELIARVH